MKSESPESPSRADRSILVATSISVVVVVVVFCLFFVMGFVSAWLKGEGELLMRGLKFGVCGSLGVLCIGLSAKAWARLAVPAWLPVTASFAVGFFVMNGLGELLDGRYETILPKAGGGFLAGCFGGMGLYWAQKRGIVPATVRSESRNAIPPESSDSESP